MSSPAIRSSIEATMRRSSSWRSPFSLSRRTAISRARATSFTLNSSMTSAAMSMRPAALMRGAIRKATSPELSGLPPSCETSSNAFNPGLTVERNALSPSLAMTRFSPASGTESAMVAMAATFINDSSSGDWSRRESRRSSKACASLNAMPAPQSDLQGYSHPGWLGFTTANAFGSPSGPGR